MAGRRRAILIVAIAAIAGCHRPELGEGEYLGLVAGRETVEVRGAQAAETARAYAWTVKLDGGRRMTVVQAEPMFAVGQRVRVVTGDGPPRMEIP
jgi:outer membrane lipoprotein SlyB